MTASIIPLPRYYGPKRRPKRGRPPKNQPKAKVIQLNAVNQVKTAYSLYCEASKIDETDPAAAIPLYEQSIALDPNLAIPYVNLGNCYFRRHDHAKAQALYEQALSIDPRIPEGLYNLGYLYLERGDPSNLERALHYFSESLKADPSFPDAHFNYAMALEQVSPQTPMNVMRAQYHWRRYIKLEPRETLWVEIAKRHLVG